jgi:hypothetical protein
MQGEAHCRTHRDSPCAAAGRGVLSGDIIASVPPAVGHVVQDANSPPAASAFLIRPGATPGCAMMFPLRSPSTEVE